MLGGTNALYSNTLKVNCQIRLKRKEKEENKSVRDVLQRFSYLIFFAF